MTIEIMKLGKMRAGAREKILASNPELRKAWEEAQTKKEKTTANPKLDYCADEKGRFTYNCSECGNIFKSCGRYAICPYCGEDTSGMVHLAYKF